jgi:ribosomal protein S18 acetylase RimI-like enzyme
MKQYSFLMESEQDNITYHVRDYNELDKRHICQVCDLINQIVVEDLKFQNKAGLQSTEQPVWGPQTIGKFLNLNYYSKLFTAEINNDIYGLVWYVERPSDEYKTKIGRVRFVIVDKNYRGLGISSKLMDLMKNWVKKNRTVTHLTVGVNYNNDAAKHLYDKFGFKPLHQNLVCKL